MDKQADVYTLTGKYQLRIIKMEPTEKEVAEAQMNDVFPALARLEKSVDDNKESIRELFSDKSLAEEIDKIKKALIQHGILTP
tara:strand:+ start:196 stop:444 length:249 start_codon:yes stop_codon:yes gene_type:complete